MISSRSSEAALKCRSCKKGRYAPLVHMIKLTETREFTPYVWVRPDEERTASIGDFGPHSLGILHIAMGRLCVPV